MTFDDPETHVRCFSEIFSDLCQLLQLTAPSSLSTGTRILRQERSALNLVSVNITFIDIIPYRWR